MSFSFPDPFSRVAARYADYRPLLAAVWDDPRQARRVSWPLGLREGIVG